MNKCKYCSKDCKLLFCSIECGGHYKKIVRDIEHQRVLDSLNKRKYTPKQEKAFNEIQRILKNGNL
jgi:hypothetical protein